MRSRVVAVTSARRACWSYQSQVEARARREQTNGLQAAIDSMIAETERVRAALEAYLSDHAVAV
jgi:hypothetical protein